MNKKNIYERVAELYHTTPEEVEKEIKAALEMAHVDMDPEVFIRTVAEKISLSH